MFQGLAGFFTSFLSEFSVDKGPLTSNATTPISLSESALDGTLRELFFNASFLEKAVVREYSAFNTMAPDNFLHLIHIFFGQDPLSTACLINKWIVFEGSRVDFENCVPSSFADTGDPEDVGFKKRSTEVVLLGKGELVYALYFGLLGSLMMSHCHCC